MWFSCIVTKLKSTFDSLICESKTKAGKCATDVFSRWRCNIFTIGDEPTYSRNSLCIPIFFDCLFTRLTGACCMLRLGAWVIDRSKSMANPQCSRRNQWLEF